MLFKLPQSMAVQLVAFSAPANYEALREPHALEAGPLTLTLPGPVALEALSPAPRGQALNGPGALGQLLAQALPQTLGSLDAADEDVPADACADDHGPAVNMRGQGRAGNIDTVGQPQRGTPQALASQRTIKESAAHAIEHAGAATWVAPDAAGPPSPVRLPAQALSRAPSSLRSPGGRRVAAIVDEWPPLPSPTTVRQLWAQYQASGLQVGFPGCLACLALCGRTARQPGPRSRLLRLRCLRLHGGPGLRCIGPPNLIH